MQRYKKGLAVERAQKAAVRAKGAAERARKAAGPAKKKGLLDKLADRKRRLAET
jgi:hypothetical protein